MSERKSETLRQREKAQRDLIELKKMQQGQLDPEDLKKDEKYVPKTFSEKASNFFFHHKWKVVFAVCAAIVLSIVIHSEVTKVRYDTTLTLYCFEYYSEENVDAVAEWMEVYFPDTNKNGKSQVSVQNCSFVLEASNKAYIDEMQRKLQSLLLEKDALFYIMDKQSLDYIKNGTSISIDLFPEENVVPLTDEFSDLIKNNATFKPNKTRYLCLRSVTDTSDENYKAAKKVIEEFKKK